MINVNMKHCLLVVIFYQLGFCQEILKNVGFEDPDLTAWKSYGFIMESETVDVQEGKLAVRCTNRTTFYQGPGQEVNLVQNGRYKFRSFVKHLNDVPGKMFQSIKITISYTWADNGQKKYYDIAAHPFVTSKSGWFSLAGDFNAPQRRPDPAINFIVDGASLRVVPEDKNWKSDANSRIERHRKGDLNISIVYPQTMNPKDIQVEINHKKHLFGFGSLVDDEFITNPEYKQYQRLFYYMFNWATVGSFKWKYAKGTPTNPDYSFAINAMNTLKKNGMMVRGHNMFWGVPKNVPDWVKKLSGTQLNNTIHERIKFLTGLTKGKIDHWDVNNELLHGQYFEEAVRDPHYSPKMYMAVKEADPRPRLFLNDYDVLSIGSSTDSYVDQALGFEADKTGLGGIGLQSHFRDFTKPDPTMLKQRLDKLALIGLPLWITELDMYIQNENARADWYEDALRMYFSHSAVHGVMFWRFWDQRMKSTYGPLVNGNNYFVNKAGKRYLHLIKKEWSTHVKQDLSLGPNINLRAFMGDYDLIVRYKGKPIIQKSFTLTLYKDISIQMEDNPVEITIAPTPNPFEHVKAHPVVTHQNEHIIGTLTVKDNAGSKFTCETRRSGFSEIGDDKLVSTSCSDDMLLTGCSSVLKNGDWHKDGEKITMSGGQTKCIAVNGFKSYGPVQAVAQCCKVNGLQCTYKTSGPSTLGIDDESVITCQNDEFPMGCGAHTLVSYMDGAFPSNKSCIAQNRGARYGVYVYGSCCKAPNLRCKVQWSKSSDLLKGDKTKVACQPGWTMTGCSAFSSFGNVAGAFILSEQGRDQCYAINGGDKFPGEGGVKSVATCCQIA